MAVRTYRPGRRADALTKQRIVAAAIQLLDTDGETALTFRALAEHLSTGSGAIYWHIGSKHELLTEATDHVVAEVVRGRRSARNPQEAIRRAALGLFDAIAAHPWVGTQLSREPWQPAVLEIVEAFGAPLDAMGVPPDEQFHCATALLHYVLGLAAQYAAGARSVAAGTTRNEFLDDITAQWQTRDPAQYPFVHRIAGQLARHDDRRQFRAGIEVILAGIATLGQHRR